MARTELRRNSARRGATLVEVLVGCGVFAFLMISSVAIMNIGTGGFRGVESKADVARQLNRFEADVTTELKRASRASVGVYTPNSDYRWALWFKTAMNSLDAIDASFQPTVPLGNSIVPITDANGEAVMQRYILFYVTRMDQAKHLEKYGYLCGSYGSTGGPDVTCPHKWVVKKELYLLQNQTSGSDTIGLQSDASSVTNLRSTALHLLSDTPVTQEAIMSEVDQATSGSCVHRANIVAQNVLSFEVTRLAVSSTDPTGTPPTVSASGPIVLFDLKVFKSLQASRVSSAGVASAAAVNFSGTASTPAGQMVDIQTSTSATGEMVVHTNTSLAASASSFTIQLDNRVIPENP